MVIRGKSESKGSQGQANNDKKTPTFECANEIPLGFF